MSQVQPDVSISEYLVCSGCLQHCNFHVEEWFGHDQIYRDPVSDCCDEPVCSSATGQPINAVQAFRIKDYENAGI